ncbi:MAG TPA: CCA tRNA nucleotidyltransferase [Phycisphaerales bacterium]|nr:CCA tRNA nucleotidyltransferase [Phycisphaerales bacterium]HMP37459.1 CCA tRNA nucleotidyltransferase [Phycisphaerales bacterium]
MTSPSHIPARAVAAEIAAALSAAGHIAYFAGGCVRDRLRGETPTDYDIATDATPATIRRLFPRALGVGEAFGVMLVRRHGRSVEVATFRSDGTYSDRRRPDAVSFGTPEQDALRRDFTINGLFEDPATGAVIDFVGGQEDLRRNLLRAIGDPAARLREDPLRALRAVRFAARFSLAIDPATAGAVGDAAALEGVSRERIGQEVRRMLGHASRATAIAQLQELGLDGVVLGEPSFSAPLPRLGGLSGLEPTGWSGAQPAPEVAARAELPMAAWLLDRVHGRRALRASDARSLAQAGGLPELLRSAIDRWSERLVLSNAERQALGEMLLRFGPAIGLVDPIPEGGAPSSGIGRRGDAPPMRWATLGVAARKRLAAGPWMQAALALLETTDRARAMQIRSEITTLAAEPGGLSPTPLLSGDDLIAEGFAPGPRFATVLRAVYDAQLEARVRTGAEAIDLARRLSDGAAPVPGGARAGRRAGRRPDGGLAPGNGAND